jgi:hypothetical protein
LRGPAYAFHPEFDRQNAQEGALMRLWRACRRVQQAILIMVITVGATLQADAQTSPSPRPSGRVSIEQVQMAFIRSAAVRGGKLYFRVRSYPFTINGLGVGGIGVSRLEATEQVCQLAQARDLEGVCRQVRVGWALAIRETAGSGCRTTRASLSCD